MKMMYGGTPVNSLKVRHYEVSTNDATLKASDLQAGVTAYARGQKVAGTGKSFEFAQYGRFETNFPMPIPDNINVIEIASTDNPIQLAIPLSDMKNLDFSNINKVATVIVDGVSYDINVQVSYNLLNVTCEKDIRLQVFYGKDNYI